MIISRTPFRISFFGGGTDYPTWVTKHGGAVIGTSINRYCYISCRHLPPFFEYKYRIAYSKIETSKTIDEIQHPVVKGVLNYLSYHDVGLEIHHDGDLPSRSGLGSSSSFTAGMLNALFALKGKQVPQKELAELAIYIEQEVLNEVVGSQDQILTSFGGLNRIDFHKTGSFTVSPIITAPSRIGALQEHLMLFFSGFSRLASEIARSQVENFEKKEQILHRMRDMVDEGHQILQTEQRPLSEFGELLHEAWECKRSLSDKVSTTAIDDMYLLARKNGAIGGKILGAGGGGFMLLFVRPKDQEQVKRALSRYLHIPFNFENEGSRIVLYQPTGFSIHV